MRCGGVIPHSKFGGLAAKKVKYSRCDHEVQKGAAHQTTDNNDGDGMQDFFSWLMSRQ